MKAKYFKKFRNIVITKSHVENRIEMLSIRIDRLLTDMELRKVSFIALAPISDGYLVKRGVVETENMIFINEKKISRLTKKIKYYKNKL